MYYFSDDRTSGQRAWNGLRLALVWVCSIVTIVGFMTLSVWLGQETQGRSFAETPSMRVSAIKFNTLFYAGAIACGYGLIVGFSARIIGQTTDCRPI